MEALATILSNCLYKSQLTFFFGLEWDSNPGPLADGTYRLAYTLRPLTYQSRYGKRDKNLIPKPDLMISDPHIHSDVITRAVGLCSASALAGIHIYGVVLLLIASQKHWQRFWAIVFTNHIWQFFGLEWDSNPGPLADGTKSPCIYAKPLT